jgi:hypothetical protein
MSNISQIKSFVSKPYFIFSIILLVFLGLRIGQVQRPLHQDEYKWPLYSHPEVYPPGSVPHPPLTEYFFKITHVVFGEDLYRGTPLVLSFINLLLLFFFIKRRFDLKTALVSSFLFSISFYSILGSLTVDTDGAILAMFTLLSLNLYDLVLLNWPNKKVYPVLLLIFMILGFMVKLSFILIPISLFIDFIILNRKKLDKRKVFFIVISAFVFIALSALFLFVSKYIFNGFSLEKGIKYWKTFMRGFFDRNFFQTFIQFIKSIFYLSPLLIFGSLLSIKYKNSKLNLFYIYTIVGLVFYLILFDFSIGALDRYLVFLVVPTITLTSYFLVSIFDDLKHSFNKKILSSGLVVIILAYILQFKNQYVPPLHPKSDWIDRIFSLKWDFLYPFSGGSGPLGFYISFSFLAICFILGLVFSLLFIFSNRKKEFALILLLVGLVYNLNFAEEFNLGKINGYSPKLVLNAVQYIKNNKDIKSVLVYNDNGGFNIRQFGKYERRVYAVPEFESSYKEIFANFKEYFLFVDIPKIKKGSLYYDYIESCKEVYFDSDKYITAKVLNCK